MEDKQSLKILVADDDRALRKGLSFELKDRGHDVWEAESVDQARDLLQGHPIELVLSDLKIPDVDDGLAIVSAAKQLNRDTTVIVLTGFASIELAVQAMQAGADDFVSKDASFEEMIVKINKFIHHRLLDQENLRIREENRRLKFEIRGRYGFNGLVGHSDAFRETLTIANKVAEDGACTVLLLGESGTGKELIARAIHYNSPRSDQPFVAVNVAALPATLLESELFGHVKGAYTDAVRDRDGKFKVAAGGTLFLDEIGDMTPDLQVKLLRVLQERTFTPLGSDHEEKADVRVIAASNQDLREKIKEKSFREDLYYRLNVVPIRLPALRDRPGDIPLLVNHFLEQFGRTRSRTLGIETEALTSLAKYRWPGNIRELENLMEQLTVLVRSDTIGLADLPEAMRGGDDTASNSLAMGDNLAEARTRLVRQFEQDFIQRALARHQWNVSKTAAAIGTSREGLHRMIKKYGLKKP